VAYGNINPEEATALFIRSALVEENLLPLQPQGGAGGGKRQGRRSHFALDVGPKAPPLPPQYSFH
jgi:hypothetical protein